MMLRTFSSLPSDRLFRASARSAGMAIWIAAWLSIAAASWFVIASATEGSPIQLRASGAGHATLENLEARIVSVDVSSIESQVVVDFKGREADGETINLLARSVLVLDDGTRLPELGGHIDERTLTLQFGPVEAGRSVSTVLLTDVAISRALPGEANESDRTFVGAYALHVLPDQIRHNDVAVANLRVAGPFGPGELHVAQVLRAEAQIVIRGTLEGFSERQIQELTIANARLVTAEGHQLTLLLGQAGFGLGLKQFEMRFSAPSDFDAAVLELPLETTPVPFEADSVLASFAGAVARVAIEIPTTPQP